MNFRSNITRNRHNIHLFTLKFKIFFFNYNSLIHFTQIEILAQVSIDDSLIYLFTSYNKLFYHLFI